MKRKLLLPSISFSVMLFSSQNLHAQPSELQRLVEAWCDEYFDNCFPGRTFIEITEIHRVDRYNNHVEIRGELHYKNLLGISQVVNFRMYIYSNRIYLKKQSLVYNEHTDQWEWQWEECSRPI